MSILAGDVGQITVEFSTPMNQQAARTVGFSIAGEEYETALTFSQWLTATVLILTVDEASIYGSAPKWQFVQRLTEPEQMKSTAGLLLDSLALKILR